jgi:hypothetical protein
VEIRRVPVAGCRVNKVNEVKWLRASPGHRSCRPEPHGHLPCPVCLGEPCQEESADEAAEAAAELELAAVIEVARGPSAGSGGDRSMPLGSGRPRELSSQEPSSVSLSSPASYQGQPHWCPGLLGVGFTPFTSFTRPRSRAGLPAGPFTSFTFFTPVWVKRVKKVKGRSESPALGQGAGEGSEGSEARSEESLASARLRRGRVKKV